MDKNISISINTGTIVRFFLLALLVVFLYTMFDVVLVVMAAIVIASSVEPLIRRMKRKGLHRIVSVIIIYILMAAMLASIFIFFVPVLARDAIQFLNTLPENISFQELWNPISSVGLNFGLAPNDISAGSISSSDFIKGLQNIIVGTSAGVFKTASVLFGGVLSFILIIILSFYLAVRDSGVEDFLRIISPVRHHEYINDLWQRSQRKIALWLQGQVILGIIIGILVYLVLIIMKIPHPLLLAVFAAALEIIPLFGPIISAVPAILLGFTTGGVGTGVVMIVLYIIINQLENHVFYPLVVKKVVGVSPIVVILALVVGAKLAGLLGALIAVPLVTAFMEYINDIEKYKKAEIAERAVMKKS